MKRSKSTYPDLFSFVKCGFAFALAICSSFFARAQYSEGFYTSSELEMMFSFADMQLGDYQPDIALRFAPVLNFALHANYDFGKSIGISAGISVKNHGFTALYDQTFEFDRVKYRVYAIGLPLGFKIGELNQESPMFFFSGYEPEAPFHYKEKRFDGRNKEEKITAWFTGRVPAINQSVYAGFQFRNGTAVKLRYYFTEFFNRSFSTPVEDPDTGERITIRPYENFRVNTFHLSLSFFPFQDLDYYLKKTDSTTGEKIITVWQ